jgi:uncharacterized protein YkwD
MLRRGRLRMTLRPKQRMLRLQPMDEQRTVLATGQLCATIPPMRKRSVLVVLLACLTLLAQPARAQEIDVATAWLARINELRLKEGLSPYHRSNQLTSAAQRHADDMAQNKLDSATGSDGSDTAARIAASGYSAWARTTGGTVTRERFWIGSASIDDALDFFLETSDRRAVILGDEYREIGIGAATGPNGSTYYVLTVAARPNVLPVFINDGAATAINPQVAIRLTNETVRPEGQGTTAIGQVIEMRISNDPEFDGQDWRPWEELVPWSLPNTLGEQSVYVQLRDAAGRTVESTDNITLISEEDSETPAAATATPVPPTPLPTTETEATEGEPAPTAVPTTSAPTAQPPATATPAAGAESGGPTPFPTWTPLPTATIEIPQKESSPPPFKLLILLQGVALLLGLYLILHRPRRS